MKYVLATVWNLQKILQIHFLMLHVVLNQFYMYHINHKIVFFSYSHLQVLFLLQIHNTLCTCCGRNKPTVSNTKCKTITNLIRLTSSSTFRPTTTFGSKLAGAQQITILERLCTEYWIKYISHLRYYMWQTKTHKNRFLYRKISHKLVLQSTV